MKKLRAEGLGNYSLSRSARNRFIVKFVCNLVFIPATRGPKGHVSGSATLP